MCPAGRKKETRPVQAAALPGRSSLTPLAKPLRECTVPLFSTAGAARNDDRPFDQDG
jgi:hypothetical protein